MEFACLDYQIIAALGLTELRFGSGDALHHNDMSLRNTTCTDALCKYNLETSSIQSLEFYETFKTALESRLSKSASRKIKPKYNSVHIGDSDAAALTALNHLISTSRQIEVDWNYLAHYEGKRPPQAKSCKSNWITSVYQTYIGENTNMSNVRSIQNRASIKFTTVHLVTIQAKSSYTAIFYIICALGVISARGDIIVMLDADGLKMSAAFISVVALLQKYFEEFEIKSTDIGDSVVIVAKNYNKHIPAVHLGTFNRFLEHLSPNEECELKLSSYILDTKMDRMEYVKQHLRPIYDQFASVSAVLCGVDVVDPATHRSMLHHHDWARKYGLKPIDKRLYIAKD